MSGQILVKFSSIKFHENPFSLSRVGTCAKTDGRNDFNRRSAGMRTKTAHCKNIRTLNTDHIKLCIFYFKHFHLLVTTKYESPKVKNNVHSVNQSVVDNSLARICTNFICTVLTLQQPKDSV